jgi:hypothetical protein
MMASEVTGLSAALTAALGEDLDSERRLVRAYLLHIRSATSPRARQALELGLALKRRHEADLVQWLGSQGGSLRADAPASDRLPGPREIVVWYYDREQALAFRYRDHARLTDDPDLRRALEQLAADQVQHLALLKNLYRDFSAA